MFCTNCGKELNPGDRFCANCGCEIKASQSEQRKYDNVVFNPPFRKEADKRTAQILKSREEFTGFKEMASENNRRNNRSKAKMDWNLDGFPESLTAKNKSGFDWNSVVERRNSGRSMGLEKIDLSSTIEHKKIDDTQIAAKKAEPAPATDGLGLPSEDSRVISLEELEKELYDLEEDLKSDTAGTNQYQSFDVENDDELDAYLDGIPKTRNKEKEAEEQKLEQEAVAAVKMGGPMKWNLADDAPKATKVTMAPMGLKWGIDASEVAAKRKAAKTALKKEREMVWDTEKKVEKKAEEQPTQPEPAEEPFQPGPAEETIQTVSVEEPTIVHTIFKEPEAVVQSEPEPIPEPEFVMPEPEPAPEPEFVMPEPEKVIPEPEAKVETEPVFDFSAAEDIKAEAEPETSFDFGSIKVPNWDMDSKDYKDTLGDFNFDLNTEEKPETPAEEPEVSVFAAEEPEAEIPAFTENVAVTEEAAPEEAAHEEEETASAAEVEDEFKDMLSVDENDDLESTKMIDHSAIKKMLDEYKMKIRAEQEEAAQEAEVVSEPEEESKDMTGISGIAAAAGIATAAAAGRPLFQEDLIHPWESSNGPAAEETEASEAVTTEEVTAEDVPAEETAADETPEEAADETPEEAAETVEEEPADTAEEFTDAVEKAEEQAEEEISAEELALEEQTEETEEPEVIQDTTETDALSEEKPMFYTFSQKNDAFQQLLDRERDRLNGLGTAYMPLNADAKVEKIVNVVDTPAYEENGVYVENILQPVQTTVADVSGDPQPDTFSRKYSFITDGDWLKEMKSAKDMDSLNKAKLRYSDLFPTPVTEHNDKEYGPADDEEAMKEKQRKAEELNKIFEDEDKNEEKPHKHIVGNIIMILLILLILFEGSVLAAKLIAPDSKYAHISDVAVEKILNLFHGEDVVVDDGSSDEDVDIDDTAIAEGMYTSMVNELSKNAKTIGEVVYNENLNYSKVPKSSFDGAESLETLKDSEWSEGTTYAGGIYSTIISYYDEWKDRNTDESLVGIDTLELGEIKQSSDGYYVLCKTTYATSDGSKAATYQTCYITLIDGKMFIDEIKGETVNE
ncbi:MAG: zinc ribbon domain-containing protein [Firmicutes bacterium]|nr:zinc ribbon domain-containing protein [Bacillota bacterium]